MPRYLVVYYSRSGVTERVANYLADCVDADVECIEEARTRRGKVGYLRSALESLASGLPAVLTRRDPSIYDRVIVGTPVWCGNMSSPVRSYLLRHAGQLPSCAFFATMGGAGGEQTVRDMAWACATPEAPTMVLRQADVERDQFREACDAFAAVMLACSDDQEARSRDPMFARAAFERDIESRLRVGG